MKLENCAVHFRDGNGQQYGHVTGARTVFEAARRALAWFEAPHWKGPRPGPETILEIGIVSDPAKRWRVRVASVPREAEQSALFDRSPAAFDPRR